MFQKIIFHYHLYHFIILFTELSANSEKSHKNHHFPFFSFKYYKPFILESKELAITQEKKTGKMNENSEHSANTENTEITAKFHFWIRIV